MEATKAPDSPPALSIAPAQFEIILAEEGSNPLAFVSPPIADISEMAELRKSSFSLSHRNGGAESFERNALQLLADLQKKAGSFSDSATFHNRVANLQRIVGDLNAEAESLTKAAELDQRTFFRRRIAENLLRQGRSPDAEELFSTLAVGDAHSALRLASTFIIGGDLTSAERWVTHALELAPDEYAPRLFQGGLLLVKGEFEKAIRILWMALNERPTSSVAYHNLALSYLGTRNPKKAFSCLKRSVALDPLNRSAILAFADIGYLLNRDADTINSIRYFVQFEQREPAIWSRLARSLIRLGSFDECILALKRQGAFEKSVSLWNNLGVAYASKKSADQSLQAFHYALTLASQDRTHEEFIVGRNIAQLVSTIGKPELLYSITNSLLESDTQLDLARDPLLCDIYGFHITALRKLGRESDALSLAERLIRDSSIGSNLARWLFKSLAGFYGLSRNADEPLGEILDKFLESDVANSKDIGLLNNVAFALCEIGRLDDAEKCISKVGYAVHHNSYLTATLGLLNLRRGHRERGEALYREAISLATSAHDKTRIKQKLYLEIGKQYAETNPVDARRVLQKVLKEKHGEPALMRQAKLLLAKLDS